MPETAYTLDQLFAVSDYSEPLTDEAREWIYAPPVSQSQNPRTGAFDVTLSLRNT